MTLLFSLFPFKKNPSFATAGRGIPKGPDAPMEKVYREGVVTLTGRGILKGPSAPTERSRQGPSRRKSDAGCCLLDQCSLAGYSINSLITRDLYNH